MQQIQPVEVVGVSCIHDLQATQSAELPVITALRFSRRNTATRKARLAGVVSQCLHHHLGANDGTAGFLRMHALDAPGSACSFNARYTWCRQLVFACVVTSAAAALLLVHRHLAGTCSIL